MDPVSSSENGARFSPVSAKSKRYCRVDGCASKASSDPSLRFHAFPKAGQYFVDIVNKFGEREKVDQREAWEIKLRIGPRMAQKITKATYICSLHFKKDDYLLPDIPAKRRYLKHDAVPSCNLPKVTVNCNKLLGRTTRTAEARRIQAAQKRMGEIKQENQQKEDQQEENVEESFEQFLPALDDDAQKLLATFQDKGVQVTSGDLSQFKFIDLITTDEKLNTLTGIPNFDILKFLITVLTCIAPKARVKLQHADEIIMTFMKLKQNISYALLSVLFGCTGENCKLVISGVIDVLFIGLKNIAIPWPAKDEVLRNIPQCFHDFPDVRCVIDCIEIAIQKPKKKCCQLATYSHYKGTYTVKFMTAVTPAGLISFVSKSYGGRSSDKAIFEQSNLIDLVEKNDALMGTKVSSLTIFAKKRY